MASEGRPPLQGAFTGTLKFPFEMTLLGAVVRRELRVDWGYTPEWEHMDRARRRLVVGALETLALRVEVKAEPDTEALQMNRKGGFSNRALWSYWTSLDLLGDGVLPSAINDEIERMIDDDARRQNAERLRRSGLA
jgi:hypothetical protein